MKSGIWREFLPTRTRGFLGDFFSLKRSSSCGSTAPIFSIEGFSVDAWTDLSAGDAVLGNGHGRANQSFLTEFETKSMEQRKSMNDGKISPSPFLNTYHLEMLYKNKKK